MAHPRHLPRHPIHLDLTEEQKGSENLSLFSKRHQYYPPRMKENQKAGRTMSAIAHAQDRPVVTKVAWKIPLFDDGIDLLHAAFFPHQHDHIVLTSRGSSLRKG